MKRFLNRIYRAVVVQIIAVGLAFIVLWALGIVIVIKGNGPSMEPTLSDGELYLQVKTKPKNIKRGDVVGVVLEDGTRITKRIIACPGDELLIGYSNIWINHEIYPEDYISYDNEGWNDFGKYDEQISLGEEDYFVMGDNRKQSQDSRHFGTIKEEQILGKVVGK